MGKRQTLIQKRRKLSALYSKGVEVRFDGDGFVIGPFEDEDGNTIDPDEDQVQIWVEAPNPLQRQECLNEASAKRALAILRAKREPDSAESASVDLQVAMLSKDDLVNQLLNIDDVDRHKRAVREVLSRDEWDDFDSLRDAMRQWEEAGFEDTPEWEELKLRDEEYAKQVSEEVESLREADEQSMQMLPREELESRLKEKRIETVGSQAFIEEYEDWMFYFAARDIDDHNVLFFQSVNEFREQNEVIQQGISQALSKFINDGAEAKNSPRAEPSSQESEPPVKQEISESSTPEAVNA